MKSFFDKIKHFLMAALLLSLPLNLFAQGEAEVDSNAVATSENDSISDGFKEVLMKILSDTIVGQTGSIHITEGNATLQVPKGFAFIDAKQTRHLLVDYWKNEEDDDIIGAFISDTATIFYNVDIAYLVSFNKDGYIKDDDAEDIDYDDLLKDIQESIKETNKERKELTGCEYDLAGWADTPHYDKDKKVLHWAKILNVYTDEDTASNLNYDIRILGKEGYCTLQAVCDLEDLNEVKDMSNALVNSVVFDEGYAYKDFDPTKDKISKYGIKGLIAGTLLAKSGLLAKLGVLLAKSAKIILVAIAAIGAFLAKIFGKKKQNAETEVVDTAIEARKEEEEEAEKEETEEESESEAEEEEKEEK